MVDEVKLQRLRARYLGAHGGEIYDPHFSAVAKQQFSGERRKWPFADVATLLGAPYRPDAANLPDFAGLDFALVGVPMDLGVTNRAGARNGPRAVRAVERVGPYEHVLRSAPLGEAKFADIGDVPMRSRFSLESCHEDIEAFLGRIVAAGVVPLSVGGDHSITLPILKAVGAKRPVGMLHIDAHCDTSGPYEGCKFHHGGPFRTYVSFDIDSLDPGFAPGTGTPEVGGLTPGEALAILRGCLGIDVVGADVVEVSPSYDPSNITAQAGAQMLFTLACLAVEARKRRRG